MDPDVSLVAWSGLVGSLLPAVLSFINQPGWSTQLKAGLAFAASLGAAAVTTYLEGGFGGGDYVTAIIATLVAAQATYQGFWKPTGIAPKLESVTSPRPKA